MMKKLLLTFVGVFMSMILIKAAPTSSLTFNGTDQYVLIPNSADFQMAADESLSFSMWLKPSAWTNAARFLGYRAGDDKDAAYEAYILTNGYACTATGVPTDTGTKGLRPIDTVISSGNASGTWTHIVIVFDRNAGTGSAYVNGSAVTGKSLTAEMVFNSTRDLILGAGYYNDEVTRYYAGSIANVRFYRGALTQAQATADMNANSYEALSSELKDMCVAAYDLTDDFTSLSVTDMSGNNNNATLQGYTAPAAEGMIASVTVTQNSDFTGRQNEFDPILSAAVTVSTGTATLQSVKINLDGSTAISDYAKVKIYSTSTSTFDDRTASGATLLGEFTPAAGDMVCNLTTQGTLSKGTTYLWVVAEVADNAVEGNKLDAALLSLTTGAETFNVAGGNPDGSREILLARKKMYAPGDNGSVGYRIPAMVILPNGNIVTAIDRRWNSEGDLANRIDIIARISEDGGYTWSEEYPIAIASDASNGRGDCALVVAPNGDIVAAFVGGNGLWASSASDPIVSFISRSSDGGRTWTAVEEGGAGDITSQIWGSSCGGDNTRLNGTAAFFGSGRGLCLTRQTGENASKNGRIMFVTAVNRGRTLYNYVVYSDDNGVTWKVSNQAYSGGDEAKVAELNDGTILMSVRRSGARGYVKSTDGGETWGTQSTWPDLNVNACNGDILEYTAKVDGYDQNRTLQSLPINDGAKGREKVSVYLSYDEGTTWERKKQMFPGLSAYSTMIMLPDGTIGMYAEDQQNNVTTSYFMRFSLSWLTDGQDVYTAPGGQERVEAPVFSPEDGTVFVSQESAVITITTATDGASIYYTTDGTEPSADNGTLYTEGGITITEDCTIKAIAVADGMTDSRIISATYEFREPAYCTLEGNANRTDRYLSTITMNGGEEPFSITNIEKSGSRPAYHDLTANVLKAAPGSEIQPKITWNGEWMHGFMYIDYNGDKSFSYEINDDGTPAEGSEIVSYTYFREPDDNQPGFNSKGETTTADSRLTNVPSFVIPDDLPGGTYRVRFKVDWNNLDPCGDNDILSNGGCIVDFTLQIPAPDYVVTVASNEEDMGIVYIGTEGTTSATSTYEGTGTLELTAVPAQGYEFVGWYLGNAQVSTEAVYTTTAITENRDYIAQFAFISVTPRSIEIVSNDAEKGTINVIEPTESAATGITQTTITTGERVVLEAVSNGEDNYFKNWVDADGNELSTETRYTYTGTDAATIKAVFASSYVITVTNTTPSYGTVTLTYTENGQLVQTGDRVDEGTSLTIKATPRSYKELSSLTINGEEHVADYSDGYTFVVEGTTNISVTFADAKYILTYNCTGGGYIEVWSEYDDYNNPAGVKYGSGDEISNSFLYIFVYPEGGESVQSITINGEPANLGDLETYGNIEVSVEGDIDIVAEFTGTTTGVEDASADAGIKIYSVKGAVAIDSEEVVSADIYTANGTLVRSVSAISGNNQIALPSGFYMVKVGTSTQKVVVP